MEELEEEAEGGKKTVKPSRGALNEINCIIVVSFNWAGLGLTSEDGPLLGFIDSVCNARVMHVLIIVLLGYNILFCRFYIIILPTFKNNTITIDPFSYNNVYPN